VGPERVIRGTRVVESLVYMVKKRRSKGEDPTSDGSLEENLSGSALAKHLSEATQG